MIQPRPYQEKCILDLREKILQGKKRILAMAPTGAGKGLLMAMLVKAGLDKGNGVLTVLYGQDLIVQTEENYKRYYGIESQIIMGGIKSDHQRSKIASISTLSRRNFPDDVTFIIIDEAHQSNSPSYAKLFEAYPNAIFIGLSATPFNNLINFEDAIVIASVQELIDLGFLVKPRHFRPKKLIDTSNVEVIKGEFDDHQLEKEALKVTGDIIAEYRERALGRTFVAFCVNVKHSLELCASFVEQGFKVKHIDGSTPLEERTEILNQLRAGKLDGVTNVNVLSTGVDVPQLSCCVMARPTHSVILYIQQGGRVLRTSTGKEDALIIDCADNVSRFGLLTDEREPVLTPKEKGKKKKQDETPIKIWTCPMCYAVNPDKELFCVDCNEARPIKIAEIKTSEGELEEVKESPVKSKKTKVVKVMPFGKYKGTPIDQLSASALHWAINVTNDGTRVDLHGVLKAELQRRMKANE